MAPSNRVREVIYRTELNDGKSGQREELQGVYRQTMVRDVDTGRVWGWKIVVCMSLYQ